MGLDYLAVGTGSVRGEDGRRVLGQLLSWIERCRSTHGDQHRPGAPLHRRGQVRQVDFGGHRSGTAPFGRVVIRVDDLCPKAILARDQAFDHEAVVQVLMAAIGHPGEVIGIADREHRLTPTELLPPLINCALQRSQALPPRGKAGPKAEQSLHVSWWEVDAGESSWTTNQVEAPINGEGRADVGQAGVSQQQGEVVGHAVELPRIDPGKQRGAARR